MILHCLEGTGVPCPPLCVSSEMWSLFPSLFMLSFGGHVVCCGRRDGVGGGGVGVGVVWCVCV